MTSEGGSLAAHSLLSGTGANRVLRQPRVRQLRWRWWLAEQVERLALYLSGGTHSLPCEGSCGCYWTGWEHEGGR